MINTATAFPCFTTPLYSGIQYNRLRMNIYLLRIFCACTILSLILLITTQVMNQRMVRDTHMLVNKDIRTVFRERREHVKKMCEQFRVQGEHTQSMGERYRVSNNRRNQRGHGDPALHKGPVLTEQEYYHAKDKRLNQKVLMSSHLLDTTRKVMYCWNHKVASSSWMWMFTKIGTGKDPPPGKPTYKIQYQMSPKTLSAYHTAVSSYQNILLVRHPVERVLSAYRDRVAGLKGSYQLYKKIGSTLHLRRVDTRLEYSVKRKKKDGSEYWSNYTKDISVPTWPEFVRYLLRTHRDQDVSRGQDNHNSQYNFTDKIIIFLSITLLTK